MVCRREYGLPAWQNLGVEFTETGRRYRMRTLGLDKMLEETQTSFEMLQERTQELEQVRNERAERRNGRREGRER